MKRFQRCSSCLYFASSFVTSSQVCSSNPDVFGQNSSVFTRAVTGGEFRNKHVRKEQTCVSDLDEITKFPHHVVTWSYFNLCFLLSSSSSVCFIVLPVLFFCFILYRRGIFPKEIALSGMQPWGSSSCDRRRKPGADGRIEEWDEWVMGGRADVWGPPCLPTMSSSLPPPPTPSRPSVSPRLSGFTLCLVFLFFSLCLPSVVVSHRSLSPLLSPLSRTFTRPCLFQQLYLHLQHCCTCSAELSVARTESQCRFASVSGSNFASDFQVEASAG